MTYSEEDFFEDVFLLYDEYEMSEESNSNTSSGRKRNRGARVSKKGTVKVKQKVTGVISYGFLAIIYGLGIIISSIGALYYLLDTTGNAGSRAVSICLAVISGVFALFFGLLFCKARAKLVR